MRLSCPITQVSDKGTVGISENTGGFFRQLRSDVAVRIFVPVFVILHLPYFYPDVTWDSVETYGLLLACLFLIPFTIFVLWPHQRKELPLKEHFFWKVLSLAFFGWWLVNVMYLLWPADS